MSLFLVSACNVQSEMFPDAPVLDFSLSGFGDDGYKIWELQGDKGIYVNEDQIDIIGLHLTLFTGGPTLIVDTVIKSPKAMMFHKKNQARGDSDILITSNRFVIKGKQWNWEGTKKKIVVEQQVRVVFNDKLYNLFMK